MNTETSQPGYTLWVVLRRDPARSANGSTEELAQRLETVRGQGVTVRGLYDVSGVKADSDLMIWLHGPDPQALQRAVRELRRAELLTTLLPTWNALGVHRDAEFSANHLPAYLRNTEPKQWLTVYPFVRSYEWYLLPEEERRRMLSEHGKMGREFPQVLANTVASFALGDYEWLLGLEADDLMDLVDLMRHLRYVDARLHVREEIPFYTGRRIELADVPEVLA